MLGILGTWVLGILVYHLPPWPTLVFRAAPALTLHCWIWMRSSFQNPQGSNIRIVPAKPWDHCHWRRTQYAGLSEWHAPVAGKYFPPWTTWFSGWRRQSNERSSGKWQVWQQSSYVYRRISIWATQLSARVWYVPLSEYLILTNLGDFKKKIAKFNARETKIAGN